MSEKTCSKCGISKPLSEFPKNKRSKGGFLNFCKKCTYAKKLSWIEENKEKHLNQRRSYAATWRQKNREKKNGYERKYKELLCDSYMKVRLRRQGFFAEKICPELIELKRKLIQAKRIIKEKKI